MINLGEYNSLVVARRMEQGIYLEDDLGNSVLLPNRYIPEGIQIADELSVFVYNDIDKSLYSMLSVYVGIRVLDIILTGRPSKKIVNIVSNNVEVLKEQIRERIEEHGTILTGIGLHQGQNKTIIYVTVDAGKIDLLKNLITKYDPDAFMIITEASEFLGRGLK